MVLLPRLANWLDIRQGEARLIARLAAVLFIIIAAHTLLETARDALFLTELEPSRLALVYGALAALAVVAARLSSLLCERLGEKRALRHTLMAGALITFGFFLLPTTHASVFVLYLWTGLFTGVAVAQFWILAARVLTIAEAKRLLGPIAAGGILGGAGGGAAGVVMLKYLTTSQLLPVAAVILAVAALATSSIRVKAGERSSLSIERPVAKQSKRPVVDRRYVRLVALLIATATVALLCLDYLFKATAARSLEAAELGPFFASYYSLLNLAAFGFQLFVSTQVLRQLGVLASASVLPVLLLVGSIATLVIGPALLLILLVKGADGSLRHSLHRTSTELLWMPLPAQVRSGSKPFVDTFVVRSAQAFGAAAVFGLSWWKLDTPPILLLGVAILAAIWLACTILLQKPYLALFRNALKDDREVVGPLRFSMGSLEVLVEALSSMNPSRAVAAIQLLASNRRARLIPALALFHPSEQVLLSALQHIPSADREDWIAPTERLIEHESENVRLAAMGALLEHGITEPIEARLSAPDPTLRGHAAFVLMERSSGAPEERSSVAALVEGHENAAVRGKIALLQAIRTRPDRRWTNVVVRLLEDPALQVSTQAVHAATALIDPRLVPPLIGRLTVRKQRELVREALVAQGPAAFEQVAALLEARDTDPRVLRHLPRTISRFASQRAADVLLTVLTGDLDGLVRYKALRGLGRLAEETEVDLDREKLEMQLLTNLREHLRMTSFRLVLEGATAPGLGEDSRQLLLDLLFDKARQALERSFRLVQLLKPGESIRAVMEAILSGDRTQRAQALEYLSTLALELKPETRELLRLATDDLEPQLLVEAARPYLQPIAEDDQGALNELVADDDEAIRAIASYHLKRVHPRLLRLAPADAPAGAGLSFGADLEALAPSDK